MIGRAGGAGEAGKDRETLPQFSASIVGLGSSGAGETEGGRAAANLPTSPDSTGADTLNHDC